MDRNLAGTGALASGARRPDRHAPRPARRAGVLVARRRCRATVDERQTRRLRRPVRAAGGGRERAQRACRRAPLRCRRRHAALRNHGGFQPAAWRDTAGRHWYPTTDGIAVFDTTRLTAAPAPPAVSLQRLLVDGASAPRPFASIPPHPGVVEIHYAAPSFRHTKWVEFEYRIRGFDDRWYAAGNSRSAVYRKLPAGELRFEVRARHAPGPCRSRSGSRSASSATCSQARGSGPRRPRCCCWAQACSAAAGTRTPPPARAAGAEAGVDRLLATGIAHDFNNVLTAIVSSSEAVARGIGLGNPLRHEAECILDAAERGSALTRQLLAFGSVQPSKPRWVPLSGESAR